MKGKTKMIWLPVKGYEGFYEVSDNGDVRSLPRLKYGRHKKDGTRSIYLTKEKMLSPKVDKDGYLSVTLTAYDGNRLMCKVHRLVAIAFLKKPNDKDIVHHKDENVQNNRVDNLMWVTPKENLFASDVFGKLSKQFSISVLCKNLSGDVIGQFSSVREAGELLGLDARHISSVLNGRRNHTRGFVFERVGD